MIGWIRWKLAWWKWRWSAGVDDVGLIVRTMDEVFGGAPTPERKAEPKREDFR